LKVLSAAQLTNLSQTLLQWYGRSGRDLPWRRTQDPYAIWISEVMLQQTQVKTVLPYYDRWLQQFPDMATLAAADLQAVLKAWEGLGYYARARSLHAAAQDIVERFGGKFPIDLDDVLTLKGIGRTTAGGILSAAFNLSLPILDGNVKRVLARLTGLMVPTAQAIESLWHVSTQLVPPNHGRDFNQAIMDLGATICTPKQPHCNQCPWQQFCQAYQQDQVGMIPVVVKKTPTPHKTIAVGMVVNDRQEILINQRPAAGLLGGLWEFPSIELDIKNDLVSELVQSIGQNFGLTVEVDSELIQVKHAYTHFKVTFHVYQCRSIAHATVLDKSMQWVDLGDLDRFPFPTSHLRMIAAFKRRQT
jgi:A/G-specific adenine glycosylase